MKIDNSKIFTADIYEVTKLTVTKNFHGDFAFGSYGFDDRQTKKGVVVIYFGKKQGYVPVW